MKLSQLKILCALEQEPTFSRVAEKLFLSQPALSTAVQALEQELNCTLLLRSNHGVTFTDAGKLALEKAHSILDGVSEIRSLAETAQQNLPDHITLGSNTHACLEILFEIYLKLEEKHHQVELNVQEIDETILLYQLMYGTLDFALFQINTQAEPTELQKLFQTYNLSYLELSKEPMTIMVNQQHPLQKQGSIKIQQLFPYPFVTAHCKTDQHLFTALQLAGYPQQPLYIEDITCFNQFIAATNYWTLIPQREALRHQMEEDCPFTFFLPADFPCYCSIGWLRQNQKHAEQEQRFLPILKEYLTLSNTDENCKTT